MKLTKLHIKNFRSIKDSGEVKDITKIFALIGRNNAGKSSFLKSIQVLFCESGVEIYDFHKDTTESIEISGTVEKISGEEVETIEVKVLCNKGEKPKYFINDNDTPKTTYSKKVPSLLSISDIRNPKDSTTGGRETTLLQKILKLQEVENEEEFAKKFQKLTQEMEKLKTRESEAISARLTEKFNDVVKENELSISITPEVNLEKGIAYATGITNKNIPNAKTVDILNSGTGIQSMYILSLLEVFGEMSSKDSDAILIIEEPEVYLHPEFQRRMFAAIRRIAENNQVIFTTHSPIMIADIWLTESVRQVRLNSDGETQIEKVKIENVIDELGIKYEDVLNPKIVIFVEGEDDIIFYKKLGLDNPKIKIISTDSFRAIHYFAFIKIITSENVNSSFILLVDGDGQKVEDRVDKIKKEITKQFNTPPQKLDEILKDRIYVLKEYAVESYLLNENSLQKVFPAIDKANLKTFLEEYNKRYKEQLELVKSGHLSLQKFQQYMKPKDIFTTFKNEQAQEAYKKAWSGCDTFLTVKGLLAESCRQLGIENKDYFNELVASTDLSEITELDEIKKSILNQLEG